MQTEITVRSIAVTANVELVKTGVYCYFVDVVSIVPHIQYSDLSCINNLAFIIPIKIKNILCCLKFGKYISHLSSTNIK